MSEDNRARFEAVAREVVEPVRRYLARRTDPDTAADVLAETLLVLWRRVEETPEQTVPWSIGVARGQLANAARGQRRRLRLVARILAVDPPRAPAPPLIADPAPETAAVAQAMATLRAQDAELLRLWAWDDIDAAGIAAMLGITPNAAAIRLTRARGKLRTALEAQDTGVGAGRTRGAPNGAPAGRAPDPIPEPIEDAPGGLDDRLAEPESPPQHPDRY